MRCVYRAHRCITQHKNISNLLDSVTADSGGNFRQALLLALCGEESNDSVHTGAMDTGTRVLGIRIHIFLWLVSG